MGTLDVRIAITVAALAVVALTAWAGRAAVISGHAGRRKAAAPDARRCSHSWLLFLPHVVAVGTPPDSTTRAPALQSRRDRHDHRYQLALRIVAVVACAALAVMVFHSSLAVSILLVALAVPAADLVAECGSWTFGGS